MCLKAGIRRGVGTGVIVEVGAGMVAVSVGMGTAVKVAGGGIDNSRCWKRWRFGRTTRKKDEADD